jgi:hypothetical protein
MILTTLETPTDPTGTAAPALSDRGWQLHLFPAHAPEGVDAEVDLRVSDELVGMYYIG